MPRAAKKKRSINGSAVKAKIEDDPGGSLALSLAHEIKNPLSIISMSIQYIHSNLSPDDPLREFTEISMRKIAKLDNIVGRLINHDGAVK